MDHQGNDGDRAPDSSPESRLILRAELRHALGVIVTHTRVVSATTLTLECPIPLQTGAKVQIVLSFPRLVEPFEVEAHATATQLASGVGQPAQVTFAIDATSGQGREVLRALVALRTGSLPKGPETKSYRCLLVDDNQFICDLFSYGMSKYGLVRRRQLSLDVAGDAEQAWSRLRAARYDMAIVDYFLPSADGSELVARIRAEPTLAAMPVVAISVGGQEARAAMMGAGADLFLDKPIVLRDLVGTLDRLVLREETP
jgi:CheY-like chemotaxis protein